MSSRPRHSCPLRPNANLGSLPPGADIVADSGVCYPSKMITKRSLQPFSILALLKRSSSQVVRPGVPFFIVGRALGPPSWWDFSGDSVTFDCLLDYHGNIQVEIGVLGEQVVVRRVGVRMWEPSDEVPVPKVGKMKYGSRRNVHFDGFEPGLSVSAAKSLLAKASIPYTEKAVANASETVVELKLPNNTYLEFFMMGGQPSLAEVQACWEYEGT